MDDTLVLASTYRQALDLLQRGERTIETDSGGGPFPGSFTHWQPHIGIREDLMDLGYRDRTGHEVIETKPDGYPGIPPTRHRCFGHAVDPGDAWHQDIVDIARAPTNIGSALD